MKKIVFYIISVLSLAISGCATLEPQEEKVLEKIESIEGIPDTILASDGDIVNLSITATGYWAVSFTGSWISASKESGQSGTSDLKLTVARNKTYDQRKARVTIVCGSDKKSFEITQMPLTALVSTVSKTDFTSDGGDFTIKLKTNVPYEIAISSEASSWITPVATKALNEYQLSYSVASNHGGYERAGSLTISSELGRDTIRITQFGFLKEDPALQNGPLYIGLARATSSTAVVAWSHDKSNAACLTMANCLGNGDFSADLNSKYKLELYADPDCSQLVVGWELNSGNNSSTAEFTSIYPPRFIFTGLESATSYYVKVRDITSDSGNNCPLKITTAAPLSKEIVQASAKEGDVILYEPFDDFYWGGDITTFACGYSRLDISKKTISVVEKAAGDNPDASTVMMSVAPSDEKGLFNYMPSIIYKLGMSEWGWIADENKEGMICARPGYVKIGASSRHGHLVTPKLKAIGGSATVKVSFMAAPYGGETIVEDEKNICVSLLSGGNVNSINRIADALTESKAFLKLDGAQGDWKEYSVTFENACSESRIAIGGAREGANVQSRFCLDEIKVEIVKVTGDGTPKYYAEGYVKYADGTPAVNVNVSDGFNVSFTDAKGYYKVTTSSDTRYIYFSYPEDAVISRNADGLPDFFQAYQPLRTRYDFTLTKCAVENQFQMYTLADPQAHYEKRESQKMVDTDRFANETVPAVNRQLALSKLPCYGITLGDVVYSENSRNSNPGLGTMRVHFSNMNLPVFQVFGNHDFTYFHTDNVLTTDSRTSTVYLKAQRAFEDVFGPINYSFNRGKVHFICMRDVNYTGNNNTKYEGGLTESQYNWLVSDLSVVPADKMVVLCMHMPIVHCTTNAYTLSILALLEQHTNSTIFAGHTHFFTLDYNPYGRTIPEHIHSAVCGQWWYSNIGCDGVPNGYNIYTFDGNKIKNCEFYGVNGVLEGKENQIRIYPGNLKAGGQYAYFQCEYGEDVLMINVFNGDPKSKVEVYEDGELSGEATLMPSSRHTFDSVTAGQTYSIPVTSSQDWWIQGYHIGVLGRGVSKTNYYGFNAHMFQFKRKSMTSKIKVMVYDTYGNVYTCDTITTGEYPDYVKCEKN